MKRSGRSRSASSNAAATEAFAPQPSDAETGPAAAMARAGVEFDVVNQILNHRLRHHDIQRMLANLSRNDKQQFFTTIAELLHKVAALLEISNRITDSLSLDNLLLLMVQITTESVEAERGTLFLIDHESSELFSRIAHGERVTEIRFPMTQGIAGAVVGSGEAVIIDDAYADPRFNRAIDQQTGYRTRNIICAPIKSRRGEIVGALQLLNKREGPFTREDLELLLAITAQASSALQNAQLFEQVQRARAEETHLLEVTTAISSELQLKPLLMKIMETTKAILDADRATLFLHDEKTGELWSQVALGLDNKEIRFPDHVGIAGSVFRSCETVNIPDAYSDDRFNPDVDRRTGYLTRSILCMPVVNRAGKPIGVMQVLNKRDGPFARFDEKRLRAFSAQAAIAIENAKLFDEVLNMKNYNESILESMSNGVITINSQGLIEKCNAAATNILGLKAEQMVGLRAERLFIAPNGWVLDRVAHVVERGLPEEVLDVELHLPEAQAAVSVNLTVVPLLDTKQQSLGAMLVFEDLTSTKRLKGTLSRYMAPEIAERLLESEGELGGQIREVTVLFSDIRQFTNISERIGATATVSLLNGYFTVMVDLILAQGGILDKFIGDAMMALFGTPVSTGEDPDRAVRSAIDMFRALDRLNRERTAAGDLPIEIGVGINTGEVVVGNIGSPKRMEYTVIGDGVNLASRLESATKFYHSDILISESTRRHLRQGYTLREVDLIRVKGKERPVRIFQVLDHLDDAAFPARNQVLAGFAAGLQRYRDRQFIEARQCFQQALEHHPGDALSRLYVQRCCSYLKNPPSADWDGVFTMATK